MSRRRVRATEAATLFDVPKASDFVSWASSSGMAKGRVKSVHKGKVPALPVKVVGTDTQPAARVEMYAQEGDGWVPTGMYVGLSAEKLTKIDALAEPSASATEAVVAGSYDAIRRQVQLAIEDNLEAWADRAGIDAEVYVYVMDLGPDWAVYCSGCGDDTFKVTYSIDAAGAVTLGDPVEVAAVTTYQPVEAPVDGPTGDVVMTEGTVKKVPDRIAGHLVEAKGVDDVGGRIFGVQIIATGDSKNGRRYPSSVLTAAAPLYEGAKAYDHHRTEAELRTSTILGLVGSYRDVEARSDGLYADLHLLPSATHTAEALDASLAAQEAGLPGLVGISHDVMVECRPILDGGRRLQEATQILSVNSADVVADPAAGGRATRMVAGGIELEEVEKPVTPEELAELLKSLTPEQLAAAGTLGAPAAAAAAPVTESAGATRTIERDGIIGSLAIESALKKTGLPASFTEAVTAQLPEQFTEADLAARLGGFQAIVAGLEKANLMPTIASTQVTQESADKKIAALDATFNGDYVNGYKSFKEAWADISGTSHRTRLDTGDVNRQILAESCGSGAGFDSQLRSTESIVSGTWNTILGDAVTRRMVAEYQQPSLMAWQALVSSIVPVNDFRTQRVERLGGYGVLPTVNQGAPYQPLTTPGNEEVTYSLNKKGGTEDLTLETIANDDLRAVTRIPIKLGLAAAQTLYRFVFDFLATNPNVFDSTALFAAGHNNVDAGNTLSQTNLSVGRKKMRKQAAYGDSSDVLSIVPKYLVVPSDLEELAFQLSTSAVAIPATPAGASNTPNIHQGIQPIVVDYFSATGTWFLVADPALCPTFELGFYQGRQDPDLLVQSDAQVGSVFTADKITYKIRHIYSGAVLDFRSWYRGN